MAFVAKEMKRLMGKAIHNQQMIRDGDHLLVAVSGGNDSLSLLWLLRGEGFKRDTDRIQNYRRACGSWFGLIRRNR